MTFKIIISGVSGRIGTQVLEQALRNPSVSSIIALSRRPLPELARYMHIEVVILEDFNVYSESVVAKLSGADGCIWCMTTTAGDSFLELDYPSAFAKAFAPTVQINGKRFRYVHLSGGMVERDQTRALWVKSGVRKIKGRGEVQMIDVAESPANGGLWHTVVARPGMVVTRGKYIGEVSMMLAGASGSFIRSDELALCLLDAVMHGSEELLVPQTILRRGRELAAARGF